MGKEQGHAPKRLDLRRGQLQTHKKFKLQRAPKGTNTDHGYMPCTTMAFTVALQQAIPCWQRVIKVTLGKYGCQRETSFVGSLNHLCWAALRDQGAGRQQELSTLSPKCYPASCH
jgi:hypothetical protein